MYKAYITDSSDIFWTKNSVDKPTLQYFNQLMESANWVDLGNITPSFINQFNATIVVDKSTYTYLKLIGPNNRIKYFSVDSINKILKNGYVLDITLDVFTTYTLGLFNTHLNNVPIKVNRTSAIGIYANSTHAQLIPDPLLTWETAKIRRQYTNNDRVYRFDTYGSTPDKNGRKIFAYTMKVDEWKLEAYASGGSIEGVFEYTDYNSVPWFNSALFDVYQDANGDFYYFPIFSDEFLSYIKVNGDFPAWGGIPQDVTYFANTNVFFVESIKQNTFWSKKYVGRYYIPHWDLLLNSSRWIVIQNWIRLNNTPGPNVSNFLFGFFHPNSIIEIKALQNGQQVKEVNVSGGYILDPNSTSPVSNWYYYSKQPVPYSTTPILNVFHTKRPLQGGHKCKYWLTTTEQLILSPGESYWRYANIKYTFSQNWGGEFFNGELDENIAFSVSGFETLPTSTNSYVNYIASVQSQQNASLKIAEQQRNANIGFGIGDSILGVAKGFLTGGPLGLLGGISSIFGGAKKVAGSVMQYENKKRAMDAKNADARRTATANNFAPSNKQSNYVNAFCLDRYPYDGQYAFSQFMGPPLLHHFGDAAKEINRTLWESGYIIDSTIRLKGFTQSKKLRLDFFDDYVNQFIYWDLDIKEEYIKLFFPNYNNELIEAIVITLNNPFRFWKIKPNYSLTTRCDFAVENMNLSTPQQNNLSILTFNYLLSRL